MEQRAIVDLLGKTALFGTLADADRTTIAARMRRVDFDPDQMIFSRGDPGREILLEKPGPPSMDDGTAETVRELVAKGATAGWIGFSTDDARATYEDLLAKGVEMTQEPTQQAYGIDFGLRDPFGNAVRILQPA